MAYSDIKQLDDAYNKLAGVIIQFYDNNNNNNICLFNWINQYY